MEEVQWDKVKAVVLAEEMRDREEIVFAPIADKGFRINRECPAIQQIALSAVIK